MLNTNYADLSFLSRSTRESSRNEHLGTEYLAVLETDHATPYYLNLHDQDVAHTLILGYTGSGNRSLLNFLIQNLQKNHPLTYIFDLGGSYESLTEIFGGSLPQRRPRIACVHDQSLFALSLRSKTSISCTCLPRS